MIHKYCINIIHSSDVEISVDINKSVLAPRGTIYTIPDNTSEAKFFADMYKAEKETQEWIRKYHRLIDGIAFLKKKVGYK